MEGLLCQVTESHPQGEPGPHPCTSVHVVMICALTGGLVANTIMTVTIKTRIVDLDTRNGTAP